MGYEFCGFKWGKEKFVRDRDQPDHTLDIPQAKDGSREAKSRSIWRPTEIELFWSWPLLWVKGSIRRLRVRLQEPSNLACALHLAMFGAKFMKISPEGFSSDHRSKKKFVCGAVSSAVTLMTLSSLSTEFVLAPNHNLPLSNWVGVLSTSSLLLSILKSSMYLGCPDEL